MSTITRRTMLLNTVVTTTLATLIPVVSAPASGRALEKSATVFHVFAFQWKDGTAEAQKERARTEILSFQGVIPGLIQTHVGPNLSSKGNGFTFGGLMQFADKASLDAYPPASLPPSSLTMAGSTDPCGRTGPQRLSSKKCASRLVCCRRTTSRPWLFSSPPTLPPNAQRRSLLLMPAGVKRFVGDWL
jgi:hypothetical protein